MLSEEFGLDYKEKGVLPGGGLLCCAKENEAFGVFNATKGKGHDRK